MSKWGIWPSSMSTDVPLTTADLNRHQTYVQMRAGGSFFASCRVCGSDPFPVRRTLADAETDARAHGSLRHVYSPAEMQQHEDHG